MAIPTNSQRSRPSYSYPDDTFDHNRPITFPRALEVTSSSSNTDPRSRYGMDTEPNTVSTALSPVSIPSSHTGKDAHYPIVPSDSSRSRRRTSNTSGATEKLRRLNQLDLSTDIEPSPAITKIEKILAGMYPDRPPRLDGYFSSPTQSPTRRSELSLHERLAMMDMNHNSPLRRPVSSLSGRRASDINNNINNVSLNYHPSSGGRARPPSPPLSIHSNFSRNGSLKDELARTQVHNGGDGTSMLTRPPRMLTNSPTPQPKPSTHTNKIHFNVKPTSEDNEIIDNGAYRQKRKPDTPRFIRTDKSKVTIVEEASDEEGLNDDPHAASLIPAPPTDNSSRESNRSLNLSRRPVDEREKVDRLGEWLANGGGNFEGNHYHNMADSTFPKLKSMLKNSYGVGSRPTPGATHPTKITRQFTKNSEVEVNEFASFDRNVRSHVTEDMRNFHKMRPDIDPRVSNNHDRSFERLQEQEVERRLAERAIEEAKRKAATEVEQARKESELAKDRIRLLEEERNRLQEIRRELRLENQDLRQREADQLRRTSDERKRQIKNHERERDSSSERNGLPAEREENQNHDARLRGSNAAFIDELRQLINEARMHADGVKNQFVEQESKIRKHADLLENLDEEVQKLSRHQQEIPQDPVASSEDIAREIRKLRDEMKIYSHRFRGESDEKDVQDNLGNVMTKFETMVKNYEELLSRYGRRDEDDNVVQVEGRGNRDNKSSKRRTTDRMAHVVDRLDRKIKGINETLDGCHGDRGKSRLKGELGIVQSQLCEAQDALIRAIHRRDEIQQHLEQALELLEKEGGQLRNAKRISPEIISSIRQKHDKNALLTDDNESESASDFDKGEDDESKAKDSYESETETETETETKYKRRKSATYHDSRHQRSKSKSKSPPMLPKIKRKSHSPKTKTSPSNRRQTIENELLRAFRDGVREGHGLGKQQNTDDEDDVESSEKPEWTSDDEFAMKASRALQITKAEMQKKRDQRKAEKASGMKTYGMPVINNYLGRERRLSASKINAKRATFVFPDSEEDDIVPSDFNIPQERPRTLKSLIEELETAYKERYAVYQSLAADHAKLGPTKSIKRRNAAANMMAKALAQLEADGNHISALHGMLEYKRWRGELNPLVPCQREIDDWKLQHPPTSSKPSGHVSV